MSKVHWPTSQFHVVFDQQFKNHTILLFEGSKLNFSYVLKYQKKKTTTTTTIETKSYTLIVNVIKVSNICNPLYFSWIVTSKIRFAGGQHPNWNHVQSQVTLKQEWNGIPSPWLVMVRTVVYVSYDTHILYVSKIYVYEYTTLHCYSYPDAKHIFVYIHNINGCCV